ncbi:MAG: cation diffusion facilitator family transporter [Nocardioidaceae bacterium]|nr:cation diffusion facilitator family transporter [Nocardioidaceae bacterium]
MLTVLVAFAANLLVAIAKSVAAALTGSASMLAEAAHSWADTGNEIFLIVAERRGSKASDEAHPLGYGKETYVWSMFAAFGLLSAGAAVSVLHGIQSLGAEESGASPLVNYVVLAVAFVLEGTSFAQALRSTRAAALPSGLHPLRYINRTSDPTLRAVFVEDSTALVGLVVAAGGVGLEQATGDPIWDALGSIVVGLVLAGAAIFLVSRNRDFLVGGGITGRIRQEALKAVLAHPLVSSVSYLHLEFVGPGKLLLVATVDIEGDDRESVLAVRLQEVEDQIRQHPMIETAVLSLSLPDEAHLEVEPG